MRRIWRPISIVLIVALLASTTAFAVLYTTKPTESEILGRYGLTPDEAEVAGMLMSIIPISPGVVGELYSVLAFSPGDVPGEVGGEPFVDDLGREVFIPGASPVETIVCLHPAATETMFYYGADGKLVAVSDAWLYWIASPADVVQEIGEGVAAEELMALNAFAVSGEAILDLEPDVVFVFGYTLPTYADAIDEIVPVICFAPTTLEDVLYDLMLIGKVVDKGAEAESLINEIRDDIIDIASMIIAEPSPKVFCEVSYYLGTIYTTGEGGFVSSLIILAGGEDIGTAVPVGNPVISSEFVIASGTEIIILLDYPWAADAASVAGRPGWDAIPAVINGEIYELSAEQIDMISRPGPRIAEGLAILLGIIHPEI